MRMIFGFGEAGSPAGSRPASSPTTRAQMANARPRGLSLHQPHPAPLVQYIEFSHRPGFPATRRIADITVIIRANVEQHHSMRCPHNPTVILIHRIAFGDLRGQANENDRSAGLDFPQVRRGSRNYLDVPSGPGRFELETAIKA